MENNLAGVIEVLCDRFGTTIDNLLPAIIEFGKYDCRLTARVCTYFLIAGIVMVLLAWCIERFSRWDHDLLSCCLIVLGTFCIVVSALIIVIALATLNEWNNFPEVMAYKYILEMIS